MEKERQKEEEEEGECTLREVRPRFRDPHPHTPQVLWHCLYERARRTQTHRISVWVSMSPGAEPIGRDKAGLIALSSASQREAFSTWTAACTPRYPSHLSATLHPRDICLLFWSFFFCPSLSPPLPFFLSGPHRLSTTNHINSRIPSPSVELSWNWLLSLHQPFSVSCAFGLVCIIFPRYKEPLTHLLLFFFSPLALAGKLYLGSANRQTYQTKSPVSRCQTLTCLSVSLGQRELPSWGVASEQTCFIWLVY